MFLMEPQGSVHSLRVTSRALSQGLELGEQTSCVLEVDERTLASPLV